MKRISTLFAGHNRQAAGNVTSAGVSIRRAVGRHA